MYFAWAGVAERGGPHYYRVQAPELPGGIRQHAERRQPHPLGLARLRRRFRPGSAQAALPEQPYKRRNRGEIADLSLFADRGASARKRT